MDNYHKYFAISDNDKKWGLYATTIGHHKTEAQQSYPQRSGHPYTHIFTWNKGRVLNGYYLVFISKGSGIIEYGGGDTQLKVEAGSCFFLFPGIWHRYKPLYSSGWEEYWIGFDGYYTEKLMKEGLFDMKNPIIYVGMNSDILTELKKTISIVRGGQPGYNRVIAGSIMQILAHLYNASVYKIQNATGQTQYISKAKFLLKDALENEVKMTKIAEELNVSYTKFRNDFKNTTGMSPNQYLLDLRIQKATELLSSTNLNINEIAYQTGFESVFYFSRFFKKKEGVSPKEYREKCTR